MCKSHPHFVHVLYIGTNYWRRVFLRLPPYVSTPESRLETARALAVYLSTHHKNTYKTPFTVDPDTFDLTPTTLEQRPALDSYMIDIDIVNFMDAHFEMPESGARNWATENAEIKDRYFSGPVYPDVAVSRFGYINGTTALEGSSSSDADSSEEDEEDTHIKGEEADSSDEDNDNATKKECDGADGIKN